MLLMAITLLSGCGSAPVAAPPSATPSAPPSAVTATTGDSVSDTATPTPEAAATATLATGVPVLSGAIPPQPGGASAPSLPIGSIVIAGGTTVYYVDYSYKETEDSTIVHSLVYRLDTKTNKKTKLRDIENRYISQLFLDGQGNLYYLCWQEDATDSGTLFQYFEKQDTKVADGVMKVVRVSSRSILYVTAASVLHEYSMETKKDTPFDSFSKLNMASGGYSGMRGMFAFADYTNDMNEPSQAYTMDLATGQVYSIFGTQDNLLYTDDGSCILKYTAADASTALEVYDFTNRTVSKCEAPVAMSLITNALVVGGRLYAVSVNDEDQSSPSTLYEIDTASGKVLTQVKCAYSVYYSLLSGGKWYFYTAVETDEEGVYPYTKQKIQVFTPGENKIKKLFDFEQSADDGSSLLFDIEGGYVWLLNYAENVGNYAIKAKFALK